VLTVVVGLGLFGLGIGLYWVFHTLTRSADAPTAAVTSLTPAPSPPVPPAARPVVNNVAPAATLPPSVAPAVAAPAVPSAAANPEAPAPTPAAATGEVTPSAAEPRAEAPAPPAAVPPPAGPANEAYEALLNKAKAALRRGQLSLVKHMLRQALRLRPQDPAALVLAGEVAIDEGDGATAVRLAHKALDLDATAADAHIVLGLAAEARGERITARTHFKKYLELSPNGDRAGDVKAILRAGH
jgi:hypothetical protein